MKLIIRKRGGLWNPKSNPNAAGPWGGCNRSGNPLGMQTALSLVSCSASFWAFAAFFLGISFPVAQSSGRWQPIATRFTMSNHTPRDLLSFLFLIPDFWGGVWASDLLSLEHPLSTKLRPGIGSYHMERSAGCPP